MTTTIGELARRWSRDYDSYKDTCLEIFYEIKSNWLFTFQTLSWEKREVRFSWEILDWDNLFMTVNQKINITVPSPEQDF